VEIRQFPDMSRRFPDISLPAWSAAVRRLAV
jgi:hypothetical protein